MWFQSLIVVAALGCVSSQNILTKLEQGVQQILNHLKERDRLDQEKEQQRVQETMDLLNMDATLRKIEQQSTEIARQLRTASGRSGVAAGEVQNLEIRIDSLENNLVSNVKGGVEKIESVQRQADSIKSEMEKRFGKIMNVMSAVHNQLKDSISQKSKSNENAESGSEAIFMSEQIDALETNMKEFMSVTKETLTSEIRNIKFEVLEPFQECKDIVQQIEELKSKCEGDLSSRTDKPDSAASDYEQTRTTNQQHIVRDLSEAMMRNLTRIQREINENLNKKLQDLERRMTTNQIVNTSYDRSKKEAERPARNQSLPVSSTNVPPRRQEAEGHDTADCRSLRYEVPRPHSCYELKQAGASCSGTYIIFPKGTKAVYAFCNMTGDGGGWTVLMRRGEFPGKQVNFDQNWEGYKAGFGDLNGEFWLGNENIRLLTSGQETMTLQIILEAFDGTTLDIKFDEFWIESEDNQYKLHLGNLDRSQAYHGSSLRHHNGRAFSTHDRNNEEEGSQNCAIRYRGGWWYNRCHYALLTAPYFSRNQFRHKWQGMQWHAWKGSEVLKSAEMRIRPKIN